jgi:hypothetical protein
MYLSPYPLPLLEKVEQNPPLRKVEPNINSVFKKGGPKIVTIF